MITKFKIFENKFNSKFKVGDFVYSIYDYDYGTIKHDTKYEISEVFFKNPKINKDIIIKNDNYLPHFEYLLKGEFGSFGPFHEKRLISEHEYDAKKYNL
jgi:hypothetical protein